MLVAKIEIQELGITIVSEAGLIVIKQDGNVVRFSTAEAAQKVIDGILTVNYGINQRKQTGGIRERTLLKETNKIGDYLKS